MNEQQNLISLIECCLMQGLNEVDGSLKTVFVQVTLNALLINHHNYITLKQCM